MGVFFYNGCMVKNTLLLCVNFQLVNYASALFFTFALGCQKES